MGLAADPRHLHLGQRTCLSGAELGVAVRPPCPDGDEALLDLIVARPPAEHRSEVVASRGEQARIELAVGGEPSAGADAAERLRHGGDDADLAGAVTIPVAPRHLAPVVRLDGLERPDGVNRPDDLGGGNHFLEPPAVGRAHVHVLDETKDVPRPPEMAGHVEHAVIVDAALDPTLQVNIGSQQVNVAG
jgi:hypothetical protein